MSLDGKLTNYASSAAKRLKLDGPAQCKRQFSYEDLHGYLFKKQSPAVASTFASMPIRLRSINQPNPVCAFDMTPNANEELPPIVRCCISTIPGAGCGIKANQVIPIGSWIGPYKGRIVKPEDDLTSIDSSYLWEIFKDGKLSWYIDGSDQNTSNWMRFIRCARHKNEQNLYAFQYMDNIYYRVFQTIYPDQELLVWYDDMYAQYLGIPCEGIYDMASSRESTNVLGNITVVTQEERFPTPPSSPGNSSDVTFQQVPLTSAPIKADTPLIRQTSKEIIRKRLYKKQACTSRTNLASQSLPTAPDLPKASNSVTEFQGQQLQASFIQTNNAVTSQFSAVVTTPTSSQPAGLARSSQPAHQFQQVANNVTQCSSLRKRYPFKDISQDDFKANVPEPPIATHSENLLASPTPEGHQSPKTQVVSEKPNSLKCGQCKKRFSQRGLLQTHVCQNTASMPYHCGHCDEHFSSPGEMILHVTIHQEKKPFKCGYCFRSFTGATTLNNHVRMHTGEKPYDCFKCGKTFTKGLQLSRHQKTPGLCVPCT